MFNHGSQFNKYILTMCDHRLTAVRNYSYTQPPVHLAFHNCVSRVRFFIAKKVKLIFYCWFNLHFSEFIMTLFACKKKENQQPICQCSLKKTNTWLSLACVEMMQISLQSWDENGLLVGHSQYRDGSVLNSYDFQSSFVWRQDVVSWNTRWSLLLMMSAW